MSKNQSEALFDKRIVHRNIKRKLLGEDEFSSYLDEMEDCAELCQEMDTRFERKIQNKGVQADQSE
jgi:hypothetical protein